MSILSKKTAAFTILEILVAVAVLGMLLVLLLNIVQSAATLWRNSENRMETYREARAAMQVISRDLNNLLPSTNTTHFIFSTNQLAFLALMPRDSQLDTSLGDVCTVGYLFAYDNKSPVAADDGRQSYNLYRYFVESNDTFTNLSQGSDLFPDFDPSTNRSEILARNIASFKVNYFTTNNAGDFTTWTQSVASPMPDLVEIRITAVNNERTMRFSPRNASAEWVDFSQPDNDIDLADYRKHTKTFTTRIPLPTP